MDRSSADCVLRRAAPQPQLPSSNPARRRPCDGQGRYKGHGCSSSDHSVDGPSRRISAEPGIRSAMNVSRACIRSKTRAPRVSSPIHERERERARERERGRGRLVASWNPGPPSQSCPFSFSSHDLMAALGGDWCQPWPDSVARSSWSASRQAAASPPRSAVFLFVFSCNVQRPVRMHVLADVKRRAPRTSWWASPSPPSPSADLDEIVPAPRVAPVLASAGRGRPGKLTTACPLPALARVAGLPGSES